MYNENIGNLGPVTPPSRVTGFDCVSSANCGETPAITPISNKVRLIQIQEVNKGYIVQAGCHTFAIETPQKLISLLSQYLLEPAKTEEKWFAGELFK